MQSVRYTIVLRTPYNASLLESFLRVLQLSVRLRSQVPVYWPPSRCIMGYVQMIYAHICLIIKARDTAGRISSLAFCY